MPPSKAAGVVKRDDGVEYFADLLDLIRLPNVYLSQMTSTSPPCYGIRHDVDHDIDNALLIAEAEAKRGFKSTYFLLTPGSYGEAMNYYGSLKDGLIVHDDTLIDKCKTFLELGHELGLHNDLVSLALKTKQDPAKLLEREVNFFARNSVTLVGTAAHGSPLARQLRYNNREIFRSCIREGWEFGREVVYQGWAVKLHTLKLDNYGFKYEAYCLPRDSRLSESGRHWGGLVAGIRLLDVFANGFNKGAFRQYIARLAPGNGVRALQVLTHPCHWDVFDDEGVKLCRDVTASRHTRTEQRGKSREVAPKRSVTRGLMSRLWTRFKRR
ncbi:MAG: hypothetical protein ACREA4_06330 [Nitrososphaera sp.]